MAEQGSVVPIPDPSTITTDQLEKLEARVMERIDERTRSAERLMDQKFDAVERVNHERFMSVTRRFEEIDRHRVEQKTDNSREIGTALSSANARMDAMGGRVDATDTRVTRLEAEKAGGSQARSGTVTLVGVVGTIIGIILGLVALNSIRNDPADTPSPVVVEVTVISP